MTNDENIEGANKKSQMVTTLAVHLVSQVVDEACIIVNSAKELGQSWQSLTKYKKFERFLEPDTDNSTFVIEMGDNDDVNIRCEANAMTTSTPQKLADEIKRNIRTDAYIIGQGDEEIYTDQDEMQEQSSLSKSTSTFINRLFDMSDVECIPDENENKVETYDSLTDDVTDILMSCLDKAFSFIFKNETTTTENSNTNIESLQSSDYSSYSLLEDAFSSNFIRNTSLCIDEDGATNSNIKICDSKYSVFGDNPEHMNFNKIAETNDVAFYEKAYVTLNRDYDQYSEEEFVNQDPKTLILQDVELTCNKTSSVHLPIDKVGYKDLASTSVVPASTVSRKSSLVRRCRLQGARLLSCLRGWWWRRKLPGRHKEPRMPGSIRGQCPLSPSVRLRASSLLDHRLIRTPSPSRPIVWKFNTINETMVNSAQWNEYTFQRKSDDVNY
ncbi:uncharacterized protein [Battus philenor]|uniref:uncharacterized protein n=1 Tax=Battus philenor TaxID=42288 RepID=UPI0035D0C7B2